MPLKARIELDNAQVLSVAMGQTSPVVAKVTRRALNRAEVLAPVDTGNLRASHSMTMKVSRTQCVGRVETRVKYATYVHNGTVPHIIRARRAKALVFNWKAQGGIRTVVPKKGRGRTGMRKGKNGAYLYISKGFVRHPGTKARPWLYRALRETATLEGFKVQATFGVGNFIEFIGG